MAVSLKHKTQAVGTDAGNGEIRKAQWNEEHTLTAAADTLLGAVTTGAVTEITCTAAGRALLDDADASAQRTTLAAAGTGVTNTFSANQIISVTDNTNAALRITQLGTGEAIRVEDSTNPDSTPFVVTADGNVGVGTAAPGQKLQVSGGAIQATNGGKDVYLNPYFLSVGPAVQVVTADPLLFVTNNTERMRVDSSGNVRVTSTGGLGYGTGSGGTVTQATSKTTTVTLNKTNGRITMNNAALAAGAAATFSLSNTTIASTDTVILSGYWGAVSAWGSRIEVVHVYTSGCDIRVTNITGGSLSEALEFNFAVIKAVTS